MADDKTRPYQMRVTEQWLDTIDGWRREQDDIPSRAEAIRRLTAIALDGIPMILEMIAYLESLTEDAEAQRTADRLRDMLDRKPQ